MEEICVTPHLTRTDQIQIFTRTAAAFPWHIAAAMASCNRRKAAVTWTMASADEMPDSTSKAGWKVPDSVLRKDRQSFTGLCHRPCDRVTCCAARTGSADATETWASQERLAQVVPCCCIPGRDWVRPQLAQRAVCQRRREALGCRARLPPHQCFHELSRELWMPCMFSIAGLSSDLILQAQVSCALNTAWLGVGEHAVLGFMWAGSLTASA